jgi:spermidine synthase
MSIPGKEIYRTYDEYGPVQVFDDGTKRYLSFGEGDEQSCILKVEPALLQHDYTRAMLLPLLYREPRDVILAGLGGGALVNCLHRHLPDLQLRAVELRHVIVKIAYRYFDLPRDERLTLIQQDISEFLEATDIAKTDIFFSDIYGSEGMDPHFFQPWYIEACARLLNDDGWLVLNCWEEQRGDYETLEAIADNFSDVYTCTVPSGNWVILASRRPSAMPETVLKQRAREQSKLLGYSVTENLYRLYHVHSRD